MPVGIKPIRLFGDPVLRTPADPVTDFDAELRKLVDTDDVKKRIHFEGGDPLTSSPDEYAADIDREEAKWGVLIRKLGLKVE